jgi:hypothetical protein
MSVGSVPARCSFVHGDRDQSNERAGPGPLTTRPSVSLGFCFQQTGQTRATSPRCYDESSACHAPQGAAARCCFVVALGRACWSGSASSLLFLLVHLVKEQLEQYVRQVKEWHDDCRGNEQATKASLIAPLFVILGYNMHDPRECKPEYRMDFGRGERAATPVDWAFLINGAFAFFVEAKEAGAKLTRYPEQLGMYFGKEPGVKGVKLGILTAGTQWQFFTDLKHDNAMDREPFFTWDVLNDDPSHPLDLLTILQKATFTPQLIRSFAERKHHQTLLVEILDRHLAPSSEFVTLALRTVVNDAGDALVSGKITERVVEQWKPILADAIRGWAKQQALTIALQRPTVSSEMGTTQEDDKPAEKAERYEVRKRFWEALLSRPKINGTRHADLTPGESGWISAGSGVRGLPFTYTIGKDEGRVELYIDRGTGKAAENKELFDGLKKHKEEIEKAFGGGLDWQRLDDKQGCRIAHTLTPGGYRSDESQWPAIQDAMIDAMIRLEQALAPHLAKLKADLAAEGG